MPRAKEKEGKLRVERGKKKNVYGCRGVKRLQIVAVCTFLRHLLFAVQATQVKYFPCGLVIPVTHADTHKQSPLNPVQFSQAFTPESHCFELTALPH